MTDMQGIIIENRAINDNLPLSRDIARHLKDRRVYGKAAIAADNPVALLGSVRRQWLRLIRLAERERASTLNHELKDQLDQVIWQMKNTSFTAQDPADDPVAHVSFATVERLRLFPPMCSTLYVVGQIKKIDKHMLTSWMHRGGMVVIYGQE